MASGSVSGRGGSHPVAVSSTVNIVGAKASEEALMTLLRTPSEEVRGYVREEITGNGRSMPLLCLLNALSAL